MRQYGRQIKLNLGNEQESIECSDLRIVFDVTKTITSEPNVAKISVFNLNKTNRNRITKGEFDRVSLMVGYSDLRLFFVGDIVNQYENRNATDTLINLECGDGAYDITYARMNKTVAANTDDAAIVTETLATMPRTDRGVIGLPVNKRLPRGRVLVGNTRDIIAKIANNNNADWCVQDGSLVMLPKDRYIEGVEGFVISKDTGMIGSPEKTSNGLKVTCLLNTGLIIGGVVKIESILESFNGVYKITELKHRGDNMGNDWFTEIICIGGEFQKANG